MRVPCGSVLSPSSAALTCPYALLHGRSLFAVPGLNHAACGGTILYAAPEQLLGLPCTAAADIFSLGLLMLAVVVGQAGQVRGLCRSPR